MIVLMNIIQSTSLLITELAFLDDELLYRDFINIMGNYNYLRTKNFKIFGKFCCTRFSCYKLLSKWLTAFFSYWKAVSVCSCDWNSLPAKPAK